MKMHQHRKPAELNFEGKLTFSKAQKNFLMRGRKITRKELLSGEKVGEGRPIPYRAPCPFYVLYNNEVFLIDKGYQQFIRESLEAFEIYAGENWQIELNPERWVDHGT